MRTFSHRKFTKVRENGRLVLVAEASDLDHWPNIYDRVWPDACDVGIQVWGKLHPVNFAVTEEVEQAGETIAWRLEPTDESKRKVPACAGVRMTIFND